MFIYIFIMTLQPSKILYIPFLSQRMIQYILPLSGGMEIQQVVGIYSQFRISLTPQLPQMLYF